MELTYDDILYLTLCSQYTYASHYNLDEATDNAWAILESEFFCNPKVGQSKLIELNDRLIAALKIMGDGDIGRGKKEYQC